VKRQVKSIDSPKVSIVIATRFRIHSLEKTLRTLTYQNEKDFEVHLINDGGNGESFELAKAFRNRLTIFHHRSGSEGNSVGAARTRNVGLKHCRAPRTLIIDEDCLCPPDLVKAHLNYGSKPVGVIGFRRYVLPEVHTRLTDEQLRVVRGIPSIPDSRAESPHLRRIANQIANKDWRIQRQCWTCHISYPTHIIRGIGGFWEEFTVSGCEDCELGLRAFRRGVRFILLHDPSVWHQNHDPDPDQVRDYDKNRTRYYMTEADTSIVVRNGGALPFVDPTKEPAGFMDEGAYI